MKKKIFTVRRDWYLILFCLLQTVVIIIYDSSFDSNSNSIHDNDVERHNNYDNETTIILNRDDGVHIIHKNNYHHILKRTTIRISSLSSLMNTKQHYMNNSIYMFLINNVMKNLQLLLLDKVRIFNYNNIHFNGVVVMAMISPQQQRIIYHQHNIYTKQQQRKKILHNPFSISKHQQQNDDYEDNIIIQNNDNKCHRRRDFLQTIIRTIPTTTIITTTGTMIMNQPSNAASESESMIAHSSNTVAEQSRLNTKIPYLMKEAYDQPICRSNLNRFYYPCITPPFLNRATYRYTLGRNTYALEQLLTLVNVTATIRTTVIQLIPNKQQNQLQQQEDEQMPYDLWVHSPLYPTEEYCSLINELGIVRHIVLPCNAFEHKAPMKAFVTKYPNATVWIASGQYGPFGTSTSTSSSDMNIISKTMGYRVDGIIPLSSNQKSSPLQYNNDIQSSSLLQPQPPWYNEFQYETLYIDIPNNAGPVSEIIFYHHTTKTLIVTDAVVYISKEFIQYDIYESYFSKSTIQSIQDFWPKTVLQSIFLPLRTLPITNNIDNTNMNDNNDTNNDNNYYYPGFDSICDQLIRAPILRGFNDARGAIITKQWITKICSSYPSFDRIITSHFISPIAASTIDLYNTFDYLFINENKKNNIGNDNNKKRIACVDWKLLDDLNEIIEQYQLGAVATFDYKQDCI